MHQYEICLVSLSGRIVSITQDSHFSDGAALEAARRLCRHDELIQLWRGDNCVYSEDISSKYAAWG